MVAAPLPLVQSWADHEHAWRASTEGVEATSDGGPAHLRDRGVDIPMRRVWTVPPNDGDWIVYGRKLAKYVGAVYYRDGVATAAGFTPR